MHRDTAGSRRWDRQPASNTCDPHRRGVAEVDGLTVPFLGREALLHNKRAAGRPEDLADLAALERS